MTVSDASVVSVQVPAPASVTSLTVVTYTCKPTANAGGLTTSDFGSFDVAVLPRAVDAVAGAAQTAADGTTALAAGAVLSGGGALSKTVQVWAGEPNATSLVSLQPNSAPTAPVTYACTSSNPSVMASIPTVTVSTAAAASVPLPPAQAVASSTLLTYTCAPTAAAGGFSLAATVAFDVLASPLAIDAVAGASAGTSAAGAALVAGAVLSGTGIASRTISLPEGSPATSTAVALRASATPAAPVTYDCTSSVPNLMASVPGIAISGTSPVAVPLPAITANVAVDTTVTYTCAPSKATPAATTAAPAPSAPAATPASGTTPAPTPSSAAAVAATVTFDVRVRRLYLIAYAAPTAVRSDSLLTFGAATDISGGAGGATPVVSLGQHTDTGTVVLLGVNQAPSSPVSLACVSSASAVMADVSGVTASSAQAAAVPLPPPAGPISGDQVITYTCSPSKAAGGLTTSDFVTFQVRGARVACVCCVDMPVSNVQCAV